MRLCSSLIAVCAGVWAQDLAITEKIVSDGAAGAAVSGERVFVAGQRIYLSFRISGFKVASEAGRIFLEYAIQPVDSLGNAFEEPFEGRMITVTRRPQTPPIRYGFELPRAPWPGEAKFRVTVRDRVAETTITEEIVFRVGSDLPETAGKFAISALRVFASEYADEPVTGGAFHAGESVWCRFLLSGFRMEAKNLYKVSYGVSLRDRMGRTLLSELKAVSDSKESYYPRWYLPGLVSVRLGSAIRPGVYTLAISATDEIGNQRASAEYAVRVE